MIKNGPPLEKSVEKEKKVVTPIKKTTPTVVSTTTTKPASPLLATIYYEPVRNPVVGPFLGVKYVNAGASLVMALKDDGTTWAWGYAQLNDYVSTKGLSSFIPVQILGQYKWKTIAMAYDYSFYGIREDGSLWAVGKSNAGQLGIGIATGNDQAFPLVQIGKDVQWQSIATGRNFVIGLKKDGTIWGWGTNKFGQLGNRKFGDTVTAPIQSSIDNQWSMISASRDHAFALKKDGSLWAWGTDYSGVLGFNKGFFFYAYPTQVGIDKDWTYISTHNSSSFGIKKDGSLWAWGYNRDNNLGVGADTSARNIPQRLDNSIKWEKVHTSGDQTIGLDENGRAWVWGFMVGNKPQLVSVDILFKDVYAGGRCFFGIRSDGSLWVWTHDTSINRNIGMPETTKLGKEPKQITQSLIGF